MQHRYARDVAPSKPRYSKRLHLQFLLYDTFFKNANVFFSKLRKNNSIFQKTGLLHIRATAPLFM